MPGREAWAREIGAETAQWREETRRAVADVVDDDLGLTARVDLDTYMRVLEARSAAASADRRFPALLEWMVRAADEQWVAVPPEAPREAPVARVRRPRPPVDVDALQARRDRLYARQQGLGQVSDDPAAARLSGRTVRRHWERMDRDLEQYAALGRQIERLDMRIREAQARTARASTD